jgi:hypothetical protein
MVLRQARSAAGGIKDFICHVEGEPRIGCWELKWVKVATTK